MDASEFERVAGIVDALPLASWVCDRDGRICASNARARAAWGANPLPEEPACWAGPGRTFTSDGILLARGGTAAATAARRGLTARDADLRLERPDGTLVACDLDASPLKGADGAVCGALVQITARAEASPAASDAPHFGEQAANAFPAQLYVLDLVDRRYSWVNDAFARFHGRERETVLAGGWEVAADAVHPDDRACLEAAAAGGLLVPEGQFHEVEVRVRDARTGMYRWLSTRSGVFERAADGSVRKIVGGALDITAQKAAEAALREAVSARDEFLSIASHELRSPIQTLRLQAELALRAYKRGDAAPFAPERVAHHAERTLVQVGRLSRLVDDMLDVARIRSGSLTLRPEPGEAVECVRAVIDRLRPEFELATTPLTLAAPEPVAGCWDRMRVEQVVTNLLTNALRYGERRPVRVTVGHDGERLVVAVHDEGVGIAPEALERIFDRFERASTRNEAGGLGLGLYICRQIARAHGGDVGVESRPGAGSTFTLRIPLERA